MHSFRLSPDDTSIHVMRYEYWAYAFSGVLIVLTLLLVPLKGLNFGIDFRGGILMEVRMPGAAADLGAMRATLGQLGLGEVALQEFGEPSDVLSHRRRHRHRWCRYRRCRRPSG
jgi:preprotein translocase subunit SecF